MEQSDQGDGLVLIMHNIETEISFGHSVIATSIQMFFWFPIDVFHWRQFCLRYGWSIGLSIIFLPLVSFPLTNIHTHITSRLHCTISPRLECFYFGKLKWVWCQSCVLINQGTSHSWLVLESVEIFHSIMNSQLVYGPLLHNFIGDNISQWW